MEVYKLKILMPYAKDNIEIEINDEKIISILEQKRVRPLVNPSQQIKDSLKTPINSLGLAELLKTENPKDVVIVVNDITRPTPYKTILPPILETIENAGICTKNVTLLVATGIHRANTKEENIASFGQDVVDKYKIVNHDPDRNLKKMSRLSDGKELEINKLAAESDFLITTGQINLHYFAGYSGGRKSILPGVASRELITSNHARMNEPGCHSGSTNENPIHKIMIEATLMAKVKFTINVVTNDINEVLSVFSGDILYAWEKGVNFCKDISTTTIKRKADVVFVSAGGYPKDINLYQAQKAIEHASFATKPGGIIVLFAACPEGYGEPTFKKWMDETQNWADIFSMFERKFELGGHKAFALARALHDKRALIVTDLSEEIIENCNLEKINNIADALQIIKDQFKDWECYVMPQGGNILPLFEEIINFH